MSFVIWATTYHKIVTVIKCQVRIDKANSVFGRLKEVWKNKHISLPIKVKLYESSVMATMLCSAELWPLTVKHVKTLEAAHHNFSDNCWEIKCNEQR